MNRRKPVKSLQIEHFTDEIKKVISMIESIPCSEADFSLAILRGIAENMLRSTYSNGVRVV